MIRATCALVALLVISASCTHAPASRAPAPELPEPKARARRVVPPPEWFWEPVDADVRAPSRKPTPLPITEGALRRLEGARGVWDDLPPDARERLLRDGVLVVGSGVLPGERANGDPPKVARSRQRPGRQESFGVFYTTLREQRVPHVITLDTLYALVHLGLQRALADVEEHELAPALDALLEKLDTRLEAEGAGVGTELAQAYRIARGVIAVARALGATSTNRIGPTQGASRSRPPPAFADLSTVVAEERGHVEGHAGISISPLLGVTLDYSRFEAPSSAMRPGLFRALAWLAAAPLTLVSRAEVPGARIDVARARVNARAAMILARLCDRDVDASLHAAYTRVRRLLTFVWGPPDDLSLSELDDLATSVGIDLTNPQNIANVTRVDRVRARAIVGRAPILHDGSGGPGRDGISVRVFGGHASSDSLVLQSLVGAPVGMARPEAAAASVDRLRRGRRVLPSTLDVIAWLGVREARAALRESHADAFEDYDAALTNLQRTRPDDQGWNLHASVHGSLVDSLFAWANAPESATPWPSPPVERARVESMLAAWTLLRHGGQALSRAWKLPPIDAQELRVSGAPLPVFVEPIPSVVARLVGTVRQVRRGLEALGPITPGSSAMLVEVEDILRAALRGAQRHASDEALAPEEASALASIPARLARLEAGGKIDSGPVVAVVYSDPTSRRVLASATGGIEPILTLARDPDGEEPLLVVGAHMTHHELVEGFERAPGVLHAVRPALTDASWRARLDRRPPTRPGWVSSFRWARGRSGDDRGYD